MPCSQNLMVIRVQGTASLVMAEALCYPCFLPPRSQKWPAERWGLHQVSERHQPDQAAARRDHKPAEKRGWKGSAGSRVWTSPSRWVPWQPCSLSLATLWPGVQMGLLVLGSPWPKQDLGAWCCSAFMSSLDAVALCGVGAECFFQHSGCLLMHTGGRWLIRSVLPQSDLVAQANLPPDATSAFLSFFFPFGVWLWEVLFSSKYMLSDTLFWTAESAVIAQDALKCLAFSDGSWSNLLSG